MGSRLAQFCIAVTDLDRSEQFYTQVMGLTVLDRIEIPDAKEIVLGSEGSSSKLQLAQKTVQQGPIDHGDEALWKFYIYTDDIEGVFRAAVEYGCQVEMRPARLEQWPVTVAMIFDPDGYRIELLQSHS